jgi:putative membrane protein
MPVVLVVYALPYAVRARSLARAGRPVAAWRVVCFAGGLLSLAVALSGPVDRLADERFAWHMAEHLLIGDVAPLLLVLGCSGPVLAPLLRSPAARVVRVLGHPVAALSFWALLLYGWHLPPLFDLALRSDAAHLAQHACFLTGGVVLWSALLGPLPKPAWFGPPARLGYVTAWWMLGGPLGAALAFAGGSFYGTYAVSDQSVGGALMLVEATTVALVLFCWQFLRIFDAAGERQELTELALAQGVDLDPRRAARAVEAGAAATLAQRIREGAPRA